MIAEFVENNLKKDPFKEFPAIGKTPDGLVVLFKSSTTGAVIKSPPEGVNKIGYISDRWDISHFTEVFDCTITYKKETP